ncbi:MAG: AAA family ATPase [Paraclostridium sp.]
MNYNEKIEKGILEIENTKEDIIIIGDNSIGKTDILFKYLDKNRDKNIYFIDSCNKKFDIKDINLSEVELIDNFPDIKDVLNIRLQKDQFNLKDSFGFSSLKLERFYLNFKEDLTRLIQTFLNIKLEFIFKKHESLGAEIQIIVDGNEIEKLSSGYQTIIRFFLELLYAQMYKVEEIVIDEINEFLSPKNAEKIFPFIKENFPEIRFILTTHSSELIASATKGKLLILEETFLEVQRLEYFETPGDIRKIYLKIFNNEQKEVKNFESIIRELLMKKRVGKLEEEDIKLLENIDGNNLNYTYQKILEKLKIDLRG